MKTVLKYFLAAMIALSGYGLGDVWAHGSWNFNRNDPANVVRLKEKFTVTEDRNRIAQMVPKEHPAATVVSPPQADTGVSVIASGFDELKELGRWIHFYLTVGYMFGSRETSVTQNGNKTNGEDIDVSQFSARPDVRFDFGLLGNLGTMGNLGLGNIGNLAVGLLIVTGDPGSDRIECRRDGIKDKSARRGHPT